MTWRRRAANVNSSCSIVRSFSIRDPCIRAAGRSVLTIAGLRQTSQAATANISATHTSAISLNSRNAIGSSTLKSSAMVPAAIIAPTDSV